MDCLELFVLELDGSNSNKNAVKASVVKSPTKANLLILRLTN